MLITIYIFHYIPHAKSPEDALKSPIYGIKNISFIAISINVKQILIKLEIFFKNCNK